MRIRSRTRWPHRGAVLIIVLIMLSLLAMLAVSLATTAALDRDVSHNYIDEVRARLVAKAGVEHAISRIYSMVQRGQYDDPSMIYWGAKSNEVGEPDEDTPLKDAVNPSYAIEDEAIQNPDDEKTTPLKLRLDEREIGISGTMSSSAYGVRSDSYRLRVSDANSRINVNDGLSDKAVTQNLRRILNQLGAACKVNEAGNRLIDRRPLTGYRARRELKVILGESDYKKMGHHITPYAWQDQDLVNPVPLSAETVGAYPVNYNEKIAVYRYGRSRSALGEKISRPMMFAPDYSGAQNFDHAVMALDELNAQWISRSKRSPVNINAASEEVLTALIADLRGLFMTERRKKNPAGSQYTFMFYPKSLNLPGNPAGSELGFLYATAPFIGPAEKGTLAPQGGAVSALTVAREIVACRSRQRSKAGDLDYSSVWYGGPFRSWRQFNAFCDSLVDREILADNRAIYFDYLPVEGGGGAFSSNSGSDILETGTSSTQSKVAARAMADVLKANFNPNCILNELNPDRNMFLEVDKTDLICNSTEFCFTPMGFFEIECEGLIIKTPRGDDLIRARAGEIQAKEVVECVVKIYDVYRETAQSELSKGNLGVRVRRLMTNSNRPLEIGPEPEAGENPDECKWSGWIQLSTIGGIRRPDGKNTVMSTPKSSKSEVGASAYAHFQFDHRLNYHASDQQHPLQFSGGFGNQPDRTEDHAGPYNPARGGRNKYRLAHTWDQEDPPPSADYTAVSDLRIDGAYIERDSSLLYPCTKDVFATVGTVAFWLKPSFRPEMTGKPRTFFSTDTFKDIGDSSQGILRWQLINGLWFFAAHDAPPYQASMNETADVNYYGGPWRPISICGGYATPDDPRTPQPYGGGVGHQTPSLNHDTHKGCAGKLSVMKHHQWMHVAYCWDMESTVVHLMVNGIQYGGTINELDVHVHPWPTNADEWTTENAIFRLGEPSSTVSFGGSRNWTVDGTLDEFYMWKGKSLETATQLFDRGRYHVPRFGQEGIFTSQPIELKGAIQGEKLADASGVRPPVSARREGGGRTTVTGDLPRPPDACKVISAFWTWHAEANNQDGDPVMFDYYDQKDLEELKTEVTLQLLVDDLPVTEALKSGDGSPVENVAVQKGQKLQYRLKVTLPQSKGGTLLLATPYIDDVTLFYTAGVDYIHYNRVDLEN